MIAAPGIAEALLATALGLVAAGSCDLRLVIVGGCYQPSRSMAFWSVVFDDIRSFGNRIVHGQGSREMWPSGTNTTVETWGGQMLNCRAAAGCLAAFGAIQA